MRDSEAAGRYLAEKHGIKRVRHDIPDGMEVNLGHSLWLFFQEELLDELATDGSKCSDNDPEQT